MPIAHSGGYELYTCILDTLLHFTGTLFARAALHRKRQFSDSSGVFDSSCIVYAQVKLHAGLHDQKVWKQYCISQLAYSSIARSKSHQGTALLVSV